MFNMKTTFKITTLLLASYPLVSQGFPITATCGNILTTMIQTPVLAFPTTGSFRRDVHNVTTNATMAPILGDESFNVNILAYISGAPYQGQTNHFAKFAKEKIPYAIDRFHNETLRVYGVLEIRLSGKYTGEPRDYLAGKGKGKYSVADIGTWPWVKMWDFSGFTKEEMNEFPHLLKWIDRIAARPAVKIGTGEKYTKDSKDSSVSKWKLE